jgi:DNA-binding transcriptional MerR regulator
VNIGELARRSGQTQSRIRFYESIGLLDVERRANGYRTYPAEAVGLLDIIDAAQKAGFSLDEIRALMPGKVDRQKHDALIGALRSKVADIEALQQRLARSKAQLAAVLADIEAKPDDIDCAANARRVISRILDRADDPPMQPGDTRLLGKSVKRNSN